MDTVQLEIAHQREELNRQNQEIHYMAEKGEITSRECARRSLEVIRQYNAIVARIL